MTIHNLLGNITDYLQYAIIYVYRFEQKHYFMLKVKDVYYYMKSFHFELKRLSLFSRVAIYFSRSIFFARKRQSRQIAIFAHFLVQMNRKSLANKDKVVEGLKRR